MVCWGGAESKSAAAVLPVSMGDAIDLRLHNLLVLTQNALDLFCNQA